MGTKTNSTYTVKATSRHKSRTTNPGMTTVMRNGRTKMESVLLNALRMFS